MDMFRCALLWLWCCYNVRYIHMISLSTFVYITAIGVTLWWPNASLVILTDKGKFDHNLTRAKHNKAWSVNMITAIEDVLRSFGIDMWVSRGWTSEITKSHYNSAACLLAEAVTSHKIGCGIVGDTKMILSGLTQSSLVTSSSSPASPFRPWIVSDHLRLCTSRAMVWRTRLVVNSSILVGSSPTIPWPLRVEIVFSMDLSSMKFELKKIAWLPVVKVWANSVRGPNPKWPPATILKNSTGQSKVTICPRNYCDTCYTPIHLFWGWSIHFWSHFSILNSFRHAETKQMRFGWWPPWWKGLIIAMCLFGLEAIIVHISHLIGGF